MAKNCLPFGFEKPEHSPGFLLWQTTMIWQRLIKKALEPHDISHAQFVIIATLLWFKAHNYDTTQTLIVTWSKLDPMTVSKSLKKLAIQGLVHRVEHETDTRAKSVTLTPKGKALVHTLVPIIEEIDAKFFGIVPHKTQKTLIGILAQLTRNTTDV
ncbi:MAG: MarR family winged helix-turn-helix transcriptional regulator [Chlamydiales bacterium]|nr:MarR family winged helix-turn-helix transcriptional regulator [Chlamydiales bacterium]